MSDTLTRLAAVLEERKNAAPDSSYVASLYHKGLNKILRRSARSRWKPSSPPRMPRPAATART